MFDYNTCMTKYGGQAIAKNRDIVKIKSRSNSGEQFVCEKIAGHGGSWKAGQLKVFNQEELDYIQPTKSTIELGFDVRGKLVEIKQDGVVIKSSGTIKVASSHSTTLNIVKVQDDRPGEQTDLDGTKHVPNQ